MAAGLRDCRKDAWTDAESRVHTVQKVYASDAEGTDVMLIGKLRICLRKGGEVLQSFVVRVVIDPESLARGAPRMKLYEVWVKPLTP